MARLDSSSGVQDWLSQYVRYISQSGCCNSEDVARMTGQVIDAELHRGYPLPILLGDVTAGLIRGATASGDDLGTVAKGAIFGVATILQGTDLELTPAVRQVAWKFIQSAIESGADPQQASSGVLRAVEALSASSLSIASALHELVWEFSAVGCTIAQMA